jgi:putative DNA primase/helicase
MSVAKQRPAWIREVIEGGGTEPEPDPLVWESLNTYRRGKDGPEIARKSLRNLTVIFDRDHRWREAIRYNDFARCIEVEGELLTDDITGELAIWVNDYYGFEPSTDMVQKAILVVARRHAYHPVRDWLRSLEWDGVERLNGLACDYLGAEDNELHSEIGRRWMISAVARAMRPGCKVDTCLILVGRQGIYKSTAFRDLAGAAWFSDTPVPMGKKDALEQIQGVWIYELAELDSVRRAEANSVKAFISALVDRFRPSYGRNAEEFPRQVIFVGSTNEPEFLTDSTGSRRFWPMEVKEVFLELIRRDREQLWAEAVRAWQAGERWWLDGESERALVQQSERFQQSDSWADIIEGWLVGKGGFVKTTDILENALGLEDASKHNRSAQMRVASIMGALGWAKCREGRTRGPRGYRR